MGNNHTDVLWFSFSDDQEARGWRCRDGRLGQQRGQRARAGAHVRPHWVRGGRAVAHGGRPNAALQRSRKGPSSGPLRGPGLLLHSRTLQGKEYSRHNNNRQPDWSIPFFFRLRKWSSWWWGWTSGTWCGALPGAWPPTATRCMVCSCRGCRLPFSSGTTATCASWKRPSTPSRVWRPESCPVTAADAPGAWRRRSGSSRSCWTPCGTPPTTWVSHS